MRPPYLQCEKVSITLILDLVLFYFRPVRGGAVISPPGIVSVCVGDDVTLMCNTTGRFLEWSFSLIPENETVSMRYSRALQPSGLNHLQVSEQRIGSTIFLYSRSSAENVLPLTSALSIGPVSEDLNGTVVNCTDATTSDTASTLINIINEELIIPQGFWKVNVSAQFESNGVVVILHWWWSTVEDYNLQSHNFHGIIISVVPQLPESVRTIESINTSIKFNVHYDTSYNVTIVAESLCGQNNVISFMELYFNQTLCQNSQRHYHDSITVMGYQIDSVATNFGCQLDIINMSKCTDSLPRSNGSDENCTSEVMIPISSKAGSISAIIGGVLAIAVLLSLGSITCAAILKFITKKDSTKPGSTGKIFSSQPLQYHPNLINTQVAKNFKDSKLAVNFYITMVVNTLFFLCSQRAHLSSFAHDYTYDSEIQLHSPDAIPKQTDTRGLVYADIGTSLNQRSYHRSLASIDLAEDRPVEYAQLKLPMVHSNVLQNDQVVEGCEDSIYVNLDNLLFQLRSQITFKWYQFGLAVGIESEILDKFAEHCAPEDCIMEMLDHWLRKSTHKPTWNDVAKALRVVELPQLALDIESVYTTGKHPVEIDNDSAPQRPNNKIMVSVATEELPPPIPPKTIEIGTPLTRPDDDDDGCEKQKQFHIMQEPTAPALPPKPKK